MGRCAGTGHCFYFYAAIPGVIASVDIADIVVAPDSITALTACLQLCDDTVGCEVALFTDSRPASGLPSREAACRLQKTVTSTVLPATPTLLNTTNQVSYAYLNDQVFITTATPAAFLYPGAKYFSPNSSVLPGPTNATACAAACRAQRPAPRFCTFDSTGAGTCTRYSTAPTIYSASASFTSTFPISANS
ncbi:g6590 [Coccomyxa elongata]